MSGLEVHAPDGIGEVAAGTDLAALVVTHLAPRDGDVVVVTSKAVAKAEGRVVASDRESVIDEETVRVVARRGPTRIARTRHGLTLAAAGVDNSNVVAGSVVPLPLDPDASARALRAEVRRRTGAVVGVVVTDTAGRAWREGQTDIAVGAAGLRVLDDHAGRVDSYGNPLAVTAPAVADEIASAAELAQGKLGGRPLALLRGRADLVLPADEDGPGAAGLVRAPERDMFGYGAREAVVAALAARVDEAELRDGFGGPAAAADVADALTRVLAVPVLVDDAGVTAPVADLHAARVSLDALTRVLGWSWEPAGTSEVRFVPGSP
ncbi:coenzyme F420-0:L-glutamate ligase/coenzyme F420-1:gamma-L-glutamate ligase [Nocardioides zeae]|uniref:Coenzyme F420-0:L-glutamate ligase/coenzyme F420-1:gamma-L-glutamate ligase n=1 Tax=Nocardioides zeae TaxID=1457234 RepID=A0ACC6IFR6_9ACTN|nr:coenzyme F420-0:L-glutamate ligase [Nocardioides zeae]MDR6176604.1 coenzyme F420-0:L-glutamate ligase/coenzyme F420-1:gamma-L-glutamate ligase [Nocardioides zeae]MDR6209616.1 coenzyme F420-0:L-glutamate ligase/coenzyme F420-1:gamma-L-glutamate ligase [Nocardioides zeae]